MRFAYRKKSTGAKVIAKRKMNAPVKRIYRKKATAPKSKPAVNKNAIMTLSRQVKSLQMTQNGQIQRAFQHISFLPTEMPTTHCPLLFCVNNLYQDAVVVRGATHNVGSDADVGTFTSAGTWLQRNDSHVASLHPMHKWDYRASLDSVSALQYNPLSSNLKFQFTFSNYYTNAPMKFRITIFSRKTSRNNDFAAINDKLPQYAGAFRNMAHDDLSQRREFSPYLHKILYDKWVTINPREDAYRDIGHHDATSASDAFAYANEKHYNRVQRFISIPWKFDGKTLKPDLDRKTATSGDYAAETFYSNVPISRQIWCCISSNITPGANGHPGNLSDIGASMQIMRSNTWRDKHGAAIS